MPTMLILRGIATDNYPRGALEEAPALEYARRMGYAGRVLDVPGKAFNGSPQMAMALQAIREDFNVAALYGFSGGGYNLRHVLNHMTPEEKERIKLVVVLGALENPRYFYEDGHWKLVYRTDPPEGHMAGPRALLNETPEPPKPTLAEPPAWDKQSYGFWSTFGRLIAAVWKGLFQKP